MKLLEEFEINLRDSTDARRKLIYVLPALFVGLLLMILIYPDATKGIEFETQRGVEIQNKIDNNAINLLTNKLNSVNDEIKTIKNQIFDIEQNNLLVQERLKELKFAFYDDLGFANNVKSILKESRELNITVSYLKTKMPKAKKKEKNQKKGVTQRAKDDENSYVKLIKQVEIDGVGKFVNIVKFIQFIEGINTLHDFSIIKIELTKDFEVHFNLIIDQYGVLFEESR